jgi:hypothetical protein
MRPLYDNGVFRPRHILEQMKVIGRSWNMTVWKRIRGALIFSLLVPMGIIVLVMGVVEGEGELFVYGGTCIKACFRNLRELATE